MMMQKQSPNNNVLDNNDDINVKSLDSFHSNCVFVSGRNPSLAGSECNDDKSNDYCSSDYESHEHDNTELENQNSLIDASNREHFKSLKKKKNKTVKVKFAGGSQDDKTGIKLKIRRTNNFNQDENHVIVEKQRKQHLKNKRCKSLSQDSSDKTKLEEMTATNNGCSDDNLSHKRTKNDSDGELRLSVGINTISKGTNVEEDCLGLCQAGTRLSLESVVLMETKSGILIVSVQWRGKSLMGALMESERFQMGSIEKDSIYRREKLNGINRRNTKRKSKSLFGKKKRKLTTPPPDENGGCTENDDVDNPYSCDKDSCRMRFTDLQTLRIHIYQKHRSGIDLCQAVSTPPNQLPVTTAGERNAFSPAYSDISDANEAPVLENEVELKPSSATAVPQPPTNLSLCQNFAASSRFLFSPNAPALQPEINLCSPALRHVNYRFPDPTLLQPGHKPSNGALSLSSASNINTVNSIQDLSVSHYQKLSQKFSESQQQHTNHKTAPNITNGHKQPNHNHIHSRNGLNSRHSLTSESGLPGQPPPSNSVQLSHNFPYVSFSPSVTNQSNKFSYPINQMSLYHQKF